ncbi:MAG: phosphate acetyltransferase [Candidatus Zixiibacteriota bacterium]
MKLIEDIQNRAKKLGRTVVLPEGDDPRTLHAAQKIIEKGIGKAIVLGKVDEIKKLAEKEGANIDEVELIDPSKSDKLDEFANEYYELRKHKGMTEDKAKEEIQDVLFFAAMLLRKDMAHAAVAGAKNTTGNVLRAALRIVGVQEGQDTVSSCFFMVLPEFMDEKDKLFVFGDCAVVPQPNAEQLADIAISSAKTAKNVLSIDPIIAMLSFSTKGSAQHDDPEKVIEATEIIQKKAPELKVDGELQLDAAIIPKVGKKKAPDSKVAGKANTLIFPDLEAGNIGYKLVQRMAKAEAVGPVIQGLKKPYNDLSRGCSIEDIVNVAAIALLNSV